MQFNVNECIVRAPNNKCSIPTHKDNLYQMNFINVHGVEAANLI